MFKSNSDSARVGVQQNREAVTLGELKKQLGYGRSGSSSGSSDIGANGGYSEATIEAFLLRYLRAKRLSTSEALAKLKRRRAFEATLPTISITPAVISVLRSGAFNLLGNDNKGRPILFLNLKDFTLPPVEVDEAQRILIVLLEFMQSKCMAATDRQSASSLQGGAGGGGARRPSNSSSGLGGASGVTDEVKPHQQSFLFLIDEEDASWSVHLPLLRKAGALYSVYSKYYPGLIDLILVAEASFEVRRGIQAALAGSDTETTRTVMMVQRSDVARYMSEEVMPACLGGKLQTNGNALSFAEAVLRHWYTTTSFIQLENNSATNASLAPGKGAQAAGRPLYVPTPLVGSSAQFVSLHRAATIAAAAATSVALKSGSSAMVSNGLGVAPEADVRSAAFTARRQSASLFSINAATAFPTSAAGGGTQADLTSQMSNSRRPTGIADDGVCSELSADDVTLDERNEAAGDGQPPAVAAPAQPLGTEESAKVREDPEYALTALEQERALRIQAEQRLKIAELGVALDPQNISSVEKRLAGIHNELNVLVADVVLRARAARGKGAEATVSQLLDLTLTALEAAAAVPEEVPAMSMAVPQQHREPENSTCCTVM